MWACPSHNVQKFLKLIEHSDMMSTLNIFQTPTKPLFLWLVGDWWELPICISPNTVFFDLHFFSGQSNSINISKQSVLSSKDKIFLVQNHIRSVQLNTHMISLFIHIVCILFVDFFKNPSWIQKILDKLSPVLLLGEKLPLLFPKYCCCEAVGTDFLINIVWRKLNCPMCQTRCYFLFLL